MASTSTGMPRSSSREYVRMSLVLSDENSERVALLKKIGELEAKETELTLHLEDLEKAFALRRAPLEGERAQVIREKIHFKSELAKYDKMTQNAYPPAPGPSEFEFVDSWWFGALGNAVVVFNLLCMGFENKLHAYSSILYVLDNMCLLWYLFELAAKWHYHRRNLFFGKPNIVWWNWLDAGIVVGGVIDQWVMTLLKQLAPFQIPIDCTFMRMLRMLRIFRLMRFLRVVRAFVKSLEVDLSWIEDAPFQIFMSAVIVVNSVVMSLELDTDWAGWFWFEQVFLIIYSFELSVRLKYAGWHFFINSAYIWNNLDFIMVCGGVVSMWLMPLVSFIQAEMSGETQKRSISLSGLENLIEVLRMCRILRLIRLVKVVRPLYELLVSVMDALGAMQGVMLLTLLVLYAGAVVFTSLIGHGTIYDSEADIPPEAESSFGSVPSSLFSLFKLMNGDMAVAYPITKTPMGELLFVIFMILSNWALLAILTSVISERMISTSRKLDEGDKMQAEEEQRKMRERRLRRFLLQLDTDNDGVLTMDEWAVIVGDEELRVELGQLANIDKNTMLDLFSCLSQSNEEIGEFIGIDDFINHLNHDKDVADRRQMMHLAHLMRKLEGATMGKISKLERDMQKVLHAVAPNEKASMMKL